jgi:hypothetical protein
VHVNAGGQAVIGKREIAEQFIVMTIIAYVGGLGFVEQRPACLPCRTL